MLIESNVVPLGKISCFTYIATPEKQSKSKLLVKDAYADKINEGLDAWDFPSEYKKEIQSSMLKS